LAEDELNQDLPVQELGESRVTELEGLVTQKGEELAKANARVTELEQALAESKEKLATVNSSLAETVASYKTLVIQSNSGVLEELIAGDSIESINESLKKAKTLISKVRQGVEAEISSTKIPAGAPQRTPPDFSALSSREKIQYGLGGKR